MLLISLPIIIGAAIMHQRLMCERYSVSVGARLPPKLPTCSMSGSFHAPGLAYEAYFSLRSTMSSMPHDQSLPSFFQWLRISVVVRHKFPTSGIQSLNSQAQILKTILRPEFASASLMVV